jgi:hypothetical protein
MPRIRRSPKRVRWRETRKVTPVKINVEIDCSPEEARRFMGLPDVEKANAVYVDAFAKAMQGAGNTEQLQEYARQLAPMGQMGLKMFQNFMEGARKAGEGGSGGGKPDA